MKTNVAARVWKTASEHGQIWPKHVSVHLIKCQFVFMLHFDAYYFH